MAIIVKGKGRRGKGRKRKGKREKKNIFHADRNNKNSNQPNNQGLWSTQKVDMDVPLERSAYSSALGQEG
jgi:hypothetical protein